MPKEEEQGSSVLTVTLNDDSGTTISPSITGLIKSSVAESIGALTDNLIRRLSKIVSAVSPSGFLRRIVPLSSKPLKRRVEKVTPVRERETNSSWTMPF